MLGRLARTASAPRRVMVKWPLDLALDLGIDVDQHLVAVGVRLLALVGRLRLRRLRPGRHDGTPGAAAMGAQVHGVQQNLEDRADVAPLTVRITPWARRRSAQRGLVGVLDAGRFLCPPGQRGDVAVRQKRDAHARIRFRRQARPGRAACRAGEKKSENRGQRRHCRRAPPSYSVRRNSSFSRARGRTPALADVANPRLGPGMRSYRPWVLSSSASHYAVHKT